MIGPRLDDQDEDKIVLRLIVGAACVFFASLGVALYHLL